MASQTSKWYRNQRGNQLIVFFNHLIITDRLLQPPDRLLQLKAFWIERSLCPWSTPLHLISNASIHPIASRTDPPPEPIFSLHPPRSLEPATTSDLPPPPFQVS